MKILMHKSASDVCLKVQSMNGKIVQGHWFNLGYCGIPWYIDRSETIVIDDNWVDISD